MFLGGVGELVGFCVLFLVLVGFGWGLWFCGFVLSSWCVVDLLVWMFLFCCEVWGFGV